MVKVRDLPPGTPEINPSDTPQQTSETPPLSSPPIHDTLEPRASPSEAAAPQARESRQSSAAEEAATLRDFGYPHGQPKSEESITRFLVQKQKRQNTLLHRFRLAMGSQRAKKLNAAFKAARAGTITSLFPESCYHGELFTVGNSRMSRRDINATIKIIQTMESVLISILQKELHRLPDKPGAQRRGRTQQQLTTPDGTQKTIIVRSNKDYIQAVKNRMLTPAEQTTFLYLAQGLPRPQPLPGTTGFRKRSFKADLLHLLGTRKPVELHKLRRLLPLQESGSLAPVLPEDSTKPEPAFTRHTSEELIRLATTLGVFKKIDT